MIGQEEVDFLHHLHVRPFPYAEEGSFTVYEDVYKRQMLNKRLNNDGQKRRWLVWIKRKAV